MKNIAVLTRNKDFCSVMERALGKDYRVAAVHSVDDFYEGRVEKPRLIIYDISPPCERAMKRCRRLKKHPSTRDVPVIAVSDAPWERERRQVFERTGAEHVLSKPFSISEFREAVYSWV